MKRLLTILWGICGRVACSIHFESINNGPGRRSHRTNQRLQKRRYGGALAYYADNTVYHLDFMDESYSGKDAIRAWWDELAAQNFDIE